MIVPPCKISRDRFKSKFYMVQSLTS
jgi:hypothetical protein